MAHKLFEWIQHAENITAKNIGQQPILWYANVQSQIASDFWETDNHVFLFVSTRRTSRNWC